MKGFSIQESELIDFVASFLNSGVLIHQNKEEKTEMVANIFHCMDSKQHLLHDLLHHILREPLRKAICSGFSHEKMELWRSSLPKVTQTSLLAKQKLEQHPSSIKRPLLVLCTTLPLEKRDGNNNNNKKIALKNPRVGILKRSFGF